MFLNHFKIAIRNIRRQPFYSWINIGGLTLSLAVGLLMLLWIWEEVKVNRFQVNGERLQRVYMGFFDANGTLTPFEHISYPLGKAGKEQIPEVEDVIIMSENGEIPLSWKERQFKARGVDATMNVFDWMSFPLLQGNFDRDQPAVPQLAISRSIAERLFGNNWEHGALGQTIEIGDGKTPIRVAAIFEDLPIYSTVQFDFVANLERYPEKDRANAWGNHNYLTYLLLHNTEDAAIVRKKITDIYANSVAYDEGEFVITQSLRQEYLYANFDEHGEANGGRIEYVRVFFFAAVFLLLIACVNFINLSTARAAKRAKEVGMRKIAGAPRFALVRQFLTESTVITFLSMTLALLLIIFALPAVRQLTGKAGLFEPNGPIFWIAFVGLGLLTAVLAGAYPAFLLSSFRVKNILQGKRFTRAGHGSIRRALVVFQFVLSFVLIVGALVIQDQVQYIKNKNLGLDRENIIEIPLSGEAKQKYALIEERLKNDPAISTLTIASVNPLGVKHRSNGVDWPGKQTGDWKIHFDMIFAQDNFPQTFGTELSAGRFYDAELRADSKAVVINQTAVNVMGLEEPIGSRIEVFGQERQVIGVMKDFHTGSLYESIPPVVIDKYQDWNSRLFLRTAAGKTTEALATLAATMEAVIPGYDLEYSFLDESYARQYTSEALMGTLARWFALFSVLISCLGMFGLSTFSAESRAKEIGVRRVLGATVFQIVQLLSTTFFRLIFVAALLAIPLAYYFSRHWLDQFAYRTDLNWWIFGAAFILILAISMITVGAQSVKAGMVNPVERLRNE